jgi:peptidoglycan hydrolase-like amidase
MALLRSCSILLVLLGPTLVRVDAQAPVPATAKLALPTLDREPLLRVLLARARRVTITLEARTRLEAPGLSTHVGPGAITITAREGRWGLARSPLRSSGEGRLNSEGKPAFTLDAVPLFGDTRRLRLAGDLILRAEDGEVEVIEEIPMEDYLVGVVGAEMNRRWPESALAAQAIVARSYAAARWMERHREPWHLDWQFGVDMAYHGWEEKRTKVADAVAATRGEVLMWRGLPVLALFHASSGGRTESFERIKPGVLAPDGKTPIAGAMPVVEDTAALPGAAGLELSSSHGHWKTDIPLPEVTHALQAWSAKSPGRPTFGTVEAVSVLERHDDSGRVATVSVRHRLEGKTRFQSLPATDFRLAVNPVRIRSLWWERCVIASKEPGYLVLQGRGFGHGCGLSQVSAWYLAKQGASAESIVSRFYAGARIERRY